MENHSFTCPNPSCGKTFVNPVKAENLCTKNAETYDACPHCLTEISIENSSIAIEENRKPMTKNVENQKTNKPVIEKESAQQLPNTKGCTHHFGYLSNRSSKENIPEECMICESIVQCMLKNVTG